MKKYQVYGIGNALVDKEFEVDDEFFADQQIEKGLMTLVAHEQQRYLLEMLTDKVGIKKRAGGGSAANTLYALSQFGGKAFFTCKVANDEIGDFYLAPGYSTEFMHVFLGTQLYSSELPADDDEFLSVEQIPLAKVIHMAKNSQILDAKTLAVLFLAAPYLGISLDLSA